MWPNTASRSERCATAHAATSAASRPGTENRSGPDRPRSIRHFGILANGCRARTLQAVPDSCRRETPPDAGDGTGTAEETRDDRPACPKCGSPSELVLTLPERPGDDPDDVLDPVRKLVRQRGPPRPGGAT